jgi:hypothetical protein
VQLYSAFWKRSPFTTTAAAPTVERSAQWLLPEDQMAVMTSVASAPRCCQYLAPLSNGVLVVKAWPSDEWAVTLPGALLGSMLIV